MDRVYAAVHRARVVFELRVEQRLAGRDFALGAMAARVCAQLSGTKEGLNRRFGLTTRVTYQFTLPKRYAASF